MASVCSKPLAGKTQLTEERAWGPGHTCQLGRGYPGGGAHLTPGDVHEHGRASRVAALAGDVGPVSGQQLTALGRPPSSPTDAAEKSRVNGSLGPSRPHWSPSNIFAVPQPSATVIAVRTTAPAAPGAA